MIDSGTLCHNHRETFYKQRVMSSFRTTEAHLSQIPAMQLLANPGYLLLALGWLCSNSLVNQAVS